MDRFLGSSAVVIAIENSWFERLRSCRLYCYQMPPATFDCLDECAGCFISRVAVVPARVKFIDDPMSELLRRGVELRFLPDLWFVRDAIVASSLQFSLIRMRNAAPRYPTSRVPNP